MRTLRRRATPSLDRPVPTDAQGHPACWKRHDRDDEQEIPDDGRGDPAGHARERGKDQDRADTQHGRRSARQAPGTPGRQREQGRANQERQHAEGRNRPRTRPPITLASLSPTTITATYPSNATIAPTAGTASAVQASVGWRRAWKALRPTSAAGSARRHDEDEADAMAPPIGAVVDRIPGKDEQPEKAADDGGVPPMRSEMANPFARRDAAPRPRRWRWASSAPSRTSATSNGNSAAVLQARR